MSDIKEIDYYDHANDVLITKHTQDVTDILDANKADRNATPEFGKYKGNLVKAASISLVDVIRLKNMGYDLLSPDPDQRRRALVYIQQNEQHHLTVNGKPFARKRVSWR